MTIIGIDPGIARMGYAIVDDGVAVKYGCIETHKDEPTEKRLHTIYDNTRLLLERYRPKKMVIESLLYGRNVSSVMAVAQARGVILLAAYWDDVPVQHVLPNEVKKAVTGRGKADKKEVQLAVQRLYHLKDIPKPDDAADALAIAYLGS